MGFELKVWNANRSQVLNTITSVTPSGIDGGFKWQRRGNGGCIQLDLTGRNDRAKLAPRGVVRLKIDGTSHFWGIVPDPPSADSADPEAVQVLGGREALRRVLLDGRAYRDRGVFAIVRDLLSRLCPPSLIYDARLIGDGTGTDAGPTLGTYYSPTSTLEAALDGLAKSAGVDWDVDAEGRIFFGRPAPVAFEVAYSGRGWRRLRVQGRETVTRALVRVATAPAGWEGESILYTGSGVPATVVGVAEGPQHGLYRAEAGFEPPEGVALVVPRAPERWLPDALNLDGGAAMDGNDTTYSAVPLTTTQKGIELESPLGRPVGVEVDYTLSPAQNMPADAYGVLLTVGGSALASMSLATTQDRRTLRVILPPDANTTGTWRARLLVGALMAVSGVSGIELRVYGVRFLFVDEAAAVRVASSFLQEPFASPAEVTLSGLTQPRPTAIVRDSPDGDVTGPADLWEYEHSPTNPRTVRIRLGSDGQSDTARAIKFAVRGGSG
ncbi:hypothetical protein DAETH_28990 [Deinococcus aetherius]|uniref:Tip attachment protein J domain-containing protein n=1 Tax=Deinococcus aetherius TaxID=200252 RepID=A0ABM8AGK1_9DEIO|nr:hypothetical protein [Deinococcus aetherius]BDP42930.1 hypothetical protein DAETH_28990 [Deinococcus aetherius]